MKVGISAPRFFLGSGVRIDHVIRSHCGSSLWQASVRRNEACVRYYRRRRGQMIRGLRHFGAAWNSLRGLLFRRDFGDFSATFRQALRGGLSLCKTHCCENSVDPKRVRHLGGRGDPDMDEVSWSGKACWKKRPTRALQVPVDPR